MQRSFVDQFTVVARAIPSPDLPSFLNYGVEQPLSHSTVDDLDPALLEGP